MCAGFSLDQVGGSSDGHLLLQTSCNVSSACKYEGVVCVWLQLGDQLPLQVSLHLHALLVVQDLPPQEDTQQSAFGQ